MPLHRDKAPSIGGVHSIIWISKDYQTEKNIWGQVKLHPRRFSRAGRRSRTVCAGAPGETFRATLLSAGISACKRPEAKSRRLFHEPESAYSALRAFFAFLGWGKGLPAHVTPDFRPFGKSPCSFLTHFGPPWGMMNLIAPGAAQLPAGSMKGTLSESCT
jgi:hypothetical protein